MFSFTYKEKIAVLLLIGIIFITIVIQHILPSKNNQDSSYPLSFEKPKEANIFAQKSLFYFDPNTLPEDSLYQLDIAQKAVRSIINYRKKGGKFYTKQKVKAMWHLSPEDFIKIEPYIQISSISKNLPTLKKYPVIDINKADSLLWRQLPIPPFLISKIMIYKHQLGGFYSIHQLKEINYFTNDIFDKIKNNIVCDSTSIVKQNINSIVLNHLAKHPYIGYSTASKIIDYRYKKVNIKNWEELKKLKLDTTCIKFLKIYFSLP